MVMTLEIHGIGGRKWNIHGPRAGEQGVALLEGSSGFWEAPITSVWMQGAFQEGATYMGFRTDPLDVVLAIGIRGASREQWMRNDTDFLLGLGSPDEEFKLVATSPTGTRSITLRLTDAPERVGDTDTSDQNFSRYVIQARAGWPRWIGEPVISSWTSETGTGEGFVTVTNPTDTWLYPQWVMDAPGKWSIPDFSWDDGRWKDRVINAPTLSAGQDLTIDTYPANEPYVSADGSNIAGRFGGVMFLHPIPPHTEATQLPVKVTGGSPGASIALRMPRNWRRPFGGDRAGAGY